jgi:phosphoglycolate phosphatase
MDDARYDAVIFDLDGTLTDPAPGIVGSFRHALAAVGRPAPEDQDLTWMIGPPIRANLVRYGLEEDLHEAAVDAYMARHSAVGLYDAVVHDGIAELLSDLRGAGRRIALATLKPVDQAEETLRHFGLDERFDVVGGRDPGALVDGKIDIVADVRRRLGGDAPVMIGDRAQDVDAGIANGLATVVVDWGYAEPGEFDATPPTHRVATVADLRTLLLGPPTTT